MSFLSSTFQPFIALVIQMSWPTIGFVIGGVTALLAVLLTLMIYRRHRQYAGKGWQSYTVRDNDTLLLIAVRHAVAVDLLAKVNKLKKPYAVSVGATILVPPLSSVPQRGAKPTTEEKVEQAVAVVAVATKHWYPMLWLPAVLGGWMLVAGISAIWFVRTAPRPPEPIAPLLSAAPATSSPRVLSATTTMPVEVPPDKNTLSIMVLNGSGVAGVAKRGAEVIQKAGYRLVSAGNADRFDYQGITIQYRSGLKVTAVDVQQLLQHQFQRFTLAEATTSATTTNVVVIIGKAPR